MAARGHFQGFASNFEIMSQSTKNSTKSSHFEGRDLAVRKTLAKHGRKGKETALADDEAACALLR